MPNPIDAILFQVLDVGQGSGNFVELYSNGALVNTLLVDLGSERAKTEAGGPSVEYIVKTLRGMATPTIDALVFSHSDSDHINLIDQLLAAFPKPADLVIRTVRYGGDYARYRKHSGKNVLDEVAAHIPPPGKPATFPTNESSFSDPQAVYPFHVTDGVELFLLNGNAAQVAPSAKRARTDVKRSSYAINTDSLVVVLRFGGHQLIATGDATGATLAECNEVLVDAVKQDYFDSLFMLTLPHHGSERTTLSLSAARSTKKRGADAGVENFEEFVLNLPAQTITASAERVRSFKHPSALLMRSYFDHLSSTIWYADPALGGNRHYYTAWFARDAGFQVQEGGKKIGWPATVTDDDWYSVQTAANIFTNLYYDPLLEFDPGAKPARALALPPIVGEVVAPPTAKLPIGVAWTYGVTAAGARTIAPLTNRESTLALRREIIAATEAKWAAESGEPIDPRAPSLRASPAEARAAWTRSVGLAAPVAAERASGFRRLRRVS